MKSRLMLGLLGCLVFTTAHARLGETLGQLKDRLGKVAEEPRKNTVIFYVETRGGSLSYTVTFNAKGKSIAETLKPIQFDDFSNVSAQGFINLQLEPYQNSKTLHGVKPGQKYSFGGKDFVCSADQWVVLDEANDILIVWTQTGLMSVMAVRREVLQ